MNLVWKIHRLASMQWNEIPFRVQEWLRKEQEATWVPPSLPSSFFSHPLPMWPFLPQEIPETTQKDVHNILSRGFYAVGSYWPPEKMWAWGWDPQTKEYWPNEEAHSIEVRFADADIKPAWELLKLSHLQLLAWGARAAVPNAKEKCIEGILSFLDEHQPFLGIGYASGIECSFRIMSLIWIGSALRDIPHTIQRRFWATLHQHAQWILRYPSRFSSANNHRIAELSALIILGRLSPPIPNLVIRDLEAELLELLPRQIYCDGVGTEQSLSYQALCMEWLLYVQVVSPDTREEIHKYIGLGCRFLVHMLDEKGNFPRIGDHDNSVILKSMESNENTILSICGAGAALLNDSYSMPPAYIPDMRLDVLGIRTIASTFKSQSMHFAKGGYSIFREASTMLVVDHGPLGFDSTAGHGHADALSVWMHHKGKPFWIDWGMYRYNGLQNKREFARSTYAHNTVVLNGKSQSEMSGPFNWKHRAKTKVVSIDLHTKKIVAQHDGYGVIHERSVQLAYDRICIEDRLLGGYSGDIEVCFWLPADVELRECLFGWDVFVNFQHIAKFVLKNNAFVQRKREEERGSAYNHLSPVLGLSWFATGVDSWKIEWIWENGI